MALPGVPALAGALLTLSLVLTACTDDPGGSSGSATGSGDDAGDGTSVSPASGPTPYLPVPDGIVLTDEGSELSLGETATVAFRPERGGEVGVLEMTVKALRRVRIQALAEWQLDKEARAATPFYVTVTVENAGETDLGGVRIPLYVLDGRDALVAANSFTTRYQPCPSTPLPDSFGPGATTTACLLYLAPRHGTLAAASFRPRPGFNPITWVGKVQQPPKPPKKKPGAGVAQ